MITPLEWSPKTCHCYNKWPKTVGSLQKHCCRLQMKWRVPENLDDHQASSPKGTARRLESHGGLDPLTNLGSPR